jgi:DNA recombination protein RmuC
MTIVWFVIGFVLGGFFCWLALRARETATQARLKTQLEMAESSQQMMSNTFDSLASRALQSNNETFIQLAKQVLDIRITEAKGDLELKQQAFGALVQPLREALANMETARQTAYGGFKEMTDQMVAAQQELAQETRNLTLALRTPQVRGRWGESTLRRVVELVGLVEHCDFAEQTSIDAEESRKRPDMIVYLPSKRQIVVDAKTPLDAYLVAIEADNDESRDKALKHHAKQVRDRYVELAAKSYWTALDFTPEFVVLFLPAEPFLSAALQQDPTLLEEAMSKRVVLATPASLFCLLHAVSYGWKQEKLAENALHIGQLGREIHDRISDWAEHLEKLGSSLRKAVDAFNDSIGSLERRVLVTARRFKDLGISSDKEVKELSQLDIAIREIPEVKGAKLPKEPGP